MNWFLMVLKKYAVFAGRARRSEYWYFVLFYMLILIVLMGVDAMTGTYSKDAGLGLLSGIFSIGTFLPSLGVAIRRLHDTGRSGWWVLISLIPLVGFIILIVFFAQDSQPGTNQYGPNPKGVDGPKAQAAA
jgi:uncharacterized membrane protein YhaH (DUF805 family)